MRLQSHRTPEAGRGRAGQTLVFMVMLLVIILFFVLWNFDLHKILYVKTLAQNGGDAAAMAAARWQAVTLNLMGDLNVLYGVALTEEADAGTGDTTASDAITGLRARILYVGPMIGMMASQQGAKNNRIYVNDDFTDYLREHVDTIRNDYPRFITEAYSNCLTEYADMLEVVCDNGVAAGPESMLLYNDYLGDHILLNKDFYNAVQSTDWCWFYFNQYDLLKDYTNYLDWSPLPRISNPTPVNSEFFGVNVTRVHGVISGHDDVEGMNKLKQSRNLTGSDIKESVVCRNGATWYCYGPKWSEPFAMSQDGFPAQGTVKDRYNYAGADAAVRIETEADAKTPGVGSKAVVWTAAAKPFGYLNVGDRPDMSQLVLGGFRDVRLIPIDASSAPSAGTFDLDWRRHCENHLPPYLSQGTSKLNSGCEWCRALMDWEDASFRQNGKDWLDQYSSTCQQTTGGGGGGTSGGTSRGH